MIFDSAVNLLTQNNHYNLEYDTIVIDNWFYKNS